MDSHWQSGDSESEDGLPQEESYCHALREVIGHKSVVCVGKLCPGTEAKKEIGKS